MAICRVTSITIQKVRLFKLMWGEGEGESSHLEQSCQFGISVGNVFRFSINQSGNHVSQGHQRQIYFCRFFQPITRASRLRLPFAARQVHQIQFSLSNTSTL